MENIIANFTKILITALGFACFAFCGIKIGIALRKKKNAKEGITNN